MLKKIILALLSTLLIFPVTVFANNDPNPVCTASYYMPEGYIKFTNGKTDKVDSNYRALFINGSIIDSANIIVENNRSLVPLRIVTTTLGGIVSWNNTTRTVTINKDKIILEVKINSRQGKANGKNITLDAEPKIYNNVTYVPLRFVSENLDADISYFDPAADNINKGIIYNIPTIFIDKKYTQKAKSKLDSVLLAQKVANEGLEKFTESFENRLDETQKISDFDEDFRLIRENIKSMEVVGEVSRYYKLSMGVYDAFIDKFNGQLYFTINSSMMSVKKVDVNDPDLYIQLYFVG